MKEQILKTIIITLFVIYMTVLAITNRLSFYIHPRYDFLTYITVAIGVIFILASVFFAMREKQNEKKLKAKTLISYSILIIPILLGFTFGARPLSSSTANQRSSDFNNYLQAENKVLTNFAISSEKFNLGDWVIAINANPQPEQFVDKNVKVSGFLLPSDSASQFYISRFVMTCCAVDVRPVGLAVNYEWQSEFKADQWLELNGVFKMIDGELVIEPQEIKSISIPVDPYIY